MGTQDRGKPKEQSRDKLGDRGKPKERYLSHWAHKTGKPKEQSRDTCHIGHTRQRSTKGAIQRYLSHWAHKTEVNQRSNPEIPVTLGTQDRGKPKEQSRDTCHIGHTRQR